MFRQAINNLVMHSEVLHAAHCIWGWMWIALMQSEEAQQVLRASKVRELFLLQSDQRGYSFLQSVIPVGSCVSCTCSDRTAEVAFDWHTEGGTPETYLLMTELPHHEGILESPSLQSDLTYTTHGKMKLALRRKWRM
jgi:endoglucanase Acf2